MENKFAWITLFWVLGLVFGFFGWALVDATGEKATCQEQGKVYLPNGDCVVSERINYCELPNGEILYKVPSIKVNFTAE